MLVKTKINSINWSQFEVCNSNKEIAFENMCRSLFVRCFLKNDEIIHSNPNNLGIEVEPVLIKETNKFISFQSKYFSNNISYMQIKDSAEKIIKHYSGCLDIVYLYCNKDLNTSNEQYKSIEKILNNVNIKLILITGQTILDKVTNFPVLTSLYFNNHQLTSSWFEEELKASLNSLGQRYNSEFNIDTKMNHYLNYFLKNKTAIKNINERKKDAIDELNSKRWYYKNYRSLIDEITNVIASYDDVNLHNILDCLKWGTNLNLRFSNEIDKVNLRINQLHMEIEKTHLKQEEHRQNIEELHRLEWLSNISSIISFTEVEKNLLQNKVLIVCGEAGTGKSQLFANSAKDIIDTGYHALLLLGQTFLSNDHLSEQIISQLELDYGIDELFDILEGIGECDNQCVIIFIDAVNESGNKNIWKMGLSRLLNKLDKYKYLRIAISVRSGYEPLVFDDSINRKIEQKEIVKLVHSGLREESPEAIQTFLNYYGIPFSPSYYLQYEMTNPLFLTLFCKTYNGKEVDMFTLFANIIHKADEEAQWTIGLDGTSEILIHLIYEIAEYKLSNAENCILKSDLFSLPFWETYGLVNSKIKFFVALERFGIINSYAYKGQEYCCIGYNLLDDFVCAKYIVEHGKNKAEIKEYLQNNLLGIENGVITRYSNQGVFIAVCNIYAQHYKEELIDIIDLIDDFFPKMNIIDDYIRSFLWQNGDAVNIHSFFDFIENHEVNYNTVWEVFIENSVKVGHPLNAELLHQVLKNKTLADRDHTWTIYINGLYTEESRIMNLIQFLDKGGSLVAASYESIKLMLILLVWLLTSSNRTLRDKASKAAIEILKNNFGMCQKLLTYFETVNDPYVLQRLYGIVFGACMKRTQEYINEYKELALYVFEHIFNQRLVYPDILLRDYARLIIERFVFEFPKEKNNFDLEEIQPPYNSEAIPIVEKQIYYKRKSENSGFNIIDMSMRPDHIDGKQGVYGDFGRYTFQAAVSDFNDVDMSNLYHYAMQFIQNELGYKDTLFGNYDKFLSSINYNRHDVKKIERIGKKYQWIAMYNILARLSDTHLLKSWQHKQYPFVGAWDPYVRDFDPTLNNNFLKPPNLPSFNSSIKDHNDFISNEQDESDIEAWSKTLSPFFKDHASKLILLDTKGDSWVLLYQYEELKNEQDILDRDSVGFKKGTQKIWTMSQSYIVKRCELDILKMSLQIRT